MQRWWNTAHREGGEKLDCFPLKKDLRVWGEPLWPGSSMWAEGGRTSTPTTPTSLPPLTPSPSPGQLWATSSSQGNGTQWLNLAFPPCLVQTVPWVQNIFDHSLPLISLSSYQFQTGSQSLDVHACYDPSTHSRKSQIDTTTTTIIILWSTQSDKVSAQYKGKYLSGRVPENLTLHRIHEIFFQKYHAKAFIQSFPMMYIKGESTFGRSQSKWGFSPKKLPEKIAF